MNKRILSSFLILLLLGCDVGRKRKDEDQGVVTTPQIVDEVEEVDDSQTTENEEEIQKIDSDSDGIFDVDEEKNGSDKNIAEFPVIYTHDVSKSVISTKFQNISTGNYEDIGVNFSGRFKLEIPQEDTTKLKTVSNKFFRKKISSLIYSKVFESSYSESQFPTIDDALLGELGCLGKKHFYRGRFLINKYYENNKFSSHKINLAYKYYFESLKGTSEISFVEAGFRIKNSIEEEESEFVSLKSYDPLFEFNSQESLISSKRLENKTSLLDDMNLSELYSKNNCIYYETHDFKYTRNGKHLSFGEVKSTVEGSNSHVFISTPKGTKWVSVNPSSFTIKSLLSYLNLEYKIVDKTQIVSINEFSNQIQENIHIEGLSDKDLSKGRWFFISSNGEDLNLKLQPGAYYYISFVTLKDMLDNARFKETVAENLSINNEVTLRNTFLGDDIEIIAEIDAILNIPAQINKLVPGYYMDSCGWGGQDDRGNDKGRSGVKDCCGCIPEATACHHTEVNLNHDQLVGWKKVNISEFPKKQFELRVFGSNRLIQPIHIDNKRIVFRFKANQEDILSTSMKLKFQNTSLNKFRTQRVISKRHRDKPRGFECIAESTKNIGIDSTKTLKFTLDIKRSGIIR